MIIGLSGWARSGKDTVADYLVEERGFVKLSFADPMRAALLALDPIINLGGHYVSLGQAVRINGWEQLKSMTDDVRPLMQRLGTEVGRNMFGQNIWVDLALKEAAKYEDVVFADCRFQNEAAAIMDKGGTVWRVHRPGVQPANDHISERDLDNTILDLAINNDGSIEKLYYEIEDALSWVREMT